jgi:hypothetical protein
MGRKPKENIAPIKKEWELSPRTLIAMSKYNGNTKLKEIAQNLKKVKSK